MSILQTGRVINGVPVCIYTLRDESGLEATFSNLGATVLSLWVPKKDGEADDILLGHDAPESRLIRFGPMFGITLGRCAGRIRHGTYTHQGETVQLSINKMGHHCHGGYLGFDKRLFTCSALTGNTLVLEYEALDREEGYPGTLKLKVTFTLADGSLAIRYQASCDRDTPVSLSNHLYFNLSGQSSGELTGHSLRLRADRLMHLDDEMVPDGELMAVAGTPFDFRQAAPVLGRPAHPQMEHTGYFDHTYLLENGDAPAAEVCDSASGRRLTLYTSMPAVHLYVNDFTSRKYAGKGGFVYSGKCAFCLEPLYPADSVNIPHFPSPMLRAGQVYDHTTRFVIGW